MIIIETELADSRRVRVFYKTLPSRAEDVRTTAEQSFFDDDDDRERERRIVSLLTGPNIQVVRAVAYPTLGARDVLQLYVRDGDDDLFACVLMTHARLRETLREPPFVEGFSHQVIQGDHLSVEGVRTAARVWVERCFPRATANLVVELWTPVPTGFFTRCSR